MSRNTNCKHERIQTWHVEETGEPAGLWSCMQCGHRFEPLPLIRTELALSAASPLPEGVKEPMDALEAAYWEFDARKNGYGAWKDRPQSERDAFKWAVRALYLTAPAPCDVEAMQGDTE